MKNLRIIGCLFLFILPQASAKIVFVSHRDGKVDEIHVMDDNGKNRRRLTQHTLSEYTPRWSPDGQQIAFVREMATQTPGTFETDMFLMNAYGDSVERITKRGRTSGPGITWSPDGETIAFVSGQNFGLQIYGIDLQSRKVRQLTRKHSHATQPDWSPDGQQIVYKDAHALTTVTIYTMNADGTNHKQLLPPKEGSVLRSTPDWSPDGQKIVFCEIEWNRKRGGELIGVRIIIFDVDSGDQTIKEFPTNWGLQSVCWMSENQVLFSAAEGLDATTDIYRYDLLSGSITNLTNTPEDFDDSMHWIAGPLDVSPNEKQNSTWGEIKNQTAAHPQ